MITPQDAAKYLEMELKETLVGLAKEIYGKGFHLPELIGLNYHN